jgi:hypothetical protein
MAVAEKHETLESIFSRNFDPSKFHLKATKIAWRWLEDHRKNCHNVVPPQFWVGLQPPLSIDIYILYIYTIFPTDWSYKLTLLMVGSGRQFLEHRSQLWGPRGVLGHFGQQTLGTLPPTMCCCHCDPGWHRIILKLCRSCMTTGGFRGLSKVSLFSVLQLE